MSSEALRASNIEMCLKRRRLWMIETEWLKTQLGQFDDCFALRVTSAYISPFGLTASLFCFLWLKDPFKFLVYFLILQWNVVFTISYAIPFQILPAFLPTRLWNYLTSHAFSYLLNPPGTPFLTEGRAFYSWKSLPQTLWSEFEKVFGLFCIVNTRLEVFRRFSSDIIKKESFIILIFCTIIRKPWP